MANRLSKIYTRTGDNGTTSLASGQRVSKSDTIFEVMGDIDELNSHIGMVKCLYSDINIEGTLEDSTDIAIDLANALTIIQHLLFNLGGELAMIGSEYSYQGIEEKHIQWLESQIDEMNSNLQPLKEFILPAGSQLMCQLHLARSVCRRAERHFVVLKGVVLKSITVQNEMQASDKSDMDSYGLQFLNRLSDWLFVVSRFVCIGDSQIQEVLWDKTILDVLK